MSRKHWLTRQFTGALAAIFLLTAVPLPAVHAGIVGTDAAVAQAEQAAVKDRLTELLARDDIREALTERGIDPAEARARVDSMTPGEARQVAGQLEELPSGGGVVGAIVFIFVLLLVTDILGLTDFYPFTR